MYEVILSHDKEGVITTYQKAGNHVHAAILAVQQYNEENESPLDGGVFSVENLPTGEVEEISLLDLIKIMGLAAEIGENLVEPQLDPDCDIVCAGG